MKIVHVIDDDAIIRHSLSLLLSVEGYQVHSYASAQGFLDGVGDERGCVVTDLHMPIMTGLDLLAKMKELGLSLPVIFMSGAATAAIVLRAMKMGATDFLHKPVEVEAMLAAVSAACDR